MVTTTALLALLARADRISDGGPAPSHIHGPRGERLLLPHGERQAARGARLLADGGAGRARRSDGRCWRPGGGASLTGAFRCGCGSRRCSMACVLGAWCPFGRRMSRVRVVGWRCAARGRSLACFPSGIVGALSRYMMTARCWDCIACLWDTKKVSS